MHDHPNACRLARRRGPACRAGVLALIAACAGLGGCGTVALTALGIGASAGVNHTANGSSSRTFTASAPQVRTASLVALQRMSIAVESIEQRDGTEVIKAKSADRKIEIELEAMNKSTTQMRATAKHNLFVHDAATAKEIVEQTQQALQTRLGGRGGNPAPELVRASSRL
ncbi:MAG TPA: DUF3568 family protein [Methylibium sp.]|uniref:DUF3568 family protein n=1 Tax=Methylibium sp. TaxID=2067992 RepID=UPI002DB9D203|nr:DUF3568 family protein [Methylibium sp.]HEU4460824.1 DUF3568 family protein [Methylibium sp.]